MNKQLIALILMILVVTIPVSAASTLEQINSIMNDVTGDATLGTNYSTSTGLPAPFGFNNAAKSCIDKKQKGESLVKFLDSDVIRTLTAIVEVMYALCTMYSIISSLLDNMLTIVKGVCLVQECTEWVFPPMVAVCHGVEKTVMAWKAATMPISLICCFVTCGFIPWCSGRSCWDSLNIMAKNMGAKGKFDASFSKSFSDRMKAYESMPKSGQPLLAKGYQGMVNDYKSIYGNKKITEIAFPEGIGSAALGSLKGHLNAKDNIWTAVACLCPTAILINLKKLKTIYQVYNCCIEQACKSGGSTESCERALSEQLCMYWEGSLLQTIIGLLIGILTMILSRIITALITKYLSFLIPLLNCFTSIMELIQIPQNIKNLVDAWEELSSAEFSDVKCQDIDTSQISQFQPNLRDRYKSTEIFTLGFESWTNKKQEAENQRAQGYNALPAPTPVNLESQVGPQDADVERAPARIEFPKRIATPTPDTEEPPEEIPEATTEEITEPEQPADEGT